MVSGQLRRYHCCILALVATSTLHPLPCFPPFRGIGQRHRQHDKQSRNLEVPQPVLIQLLPVQPEGLDRNGPSRAAVRWNGHLVAKGNGQGGVFGCWIHEER